MKNLLSNLPQFIYDILDCLDECVYIADKNGIVQYYNKASEDLDQLKRNDVIGKHVSDSFNFAKSGSVSMILEALSEEKPLVNYFQKYFTYYGKNINGISSAYPLYINDELIGVFAITRDIDKYKELLKIYNNFFNSELPDYSLDRTRKQDENFTFERILGQNELIKECIAVARKVSEKKSPVMLIGDTGTGKEMFAQSIHHASKVKGSFVALNCSAVPSNLLEGLLFGTAEGAFTGATNRPGLFEQASKGTLFLDELNSMSLTLQAKLLRVIETGKFRRVGENVERFSTMRIISALGMPPDQCINTDTLRKDLYYRIGVISIYLPALKDRKDDIPDLIDHFIKSYNNVFKCNVQRLSSDSLRLLLSYDWPGNIRELKNVIEHAFNVIGSHNVISLEHLPLHISSRKQAYYRSPEQNVSSEQQETISEIADLNLLLRTVEKNSIHEAMAKFDGNKNKAAKALGISRQNLDYKIRRLNLK